MDSETIALRACLATPEPERNYIEDLPTIVEQLGGACRRGEDFDHLGQAPISSQEAIVEIIHQVRRILFPGYFVPYRLDPVSLDYYLGQELTILFGELSSQITSAVRHDCQRYELPCSQCTAQGQEKAGQFLADLPRLRRVLTTDIKAAFEGDPASRSYDEIIFCYPGFFATLVYRMAHVLYELDVPLVPRIMTEYAHHRTGIDIHPGARIGESFFIDHGTGVVIGATSIIGRQVRLYQGVTLGALSLPREEVERLRTVKRHPTIEDDVVVYSGTTILGGGTIIGARSIIGGNVWLTESVPPDTKVLMKRPELVFHGQGKD